MKRLIAICIIFGLSLGFAAKSRAAYTIDADLSDWGVTPFSDWIPGSCSVDYIVTNNVNTYNVHGYTEKFDFEAFYFDNDIANFYFAIVSSYPMGTGESGGDLGLDFDNDHTISTHGVVTGLDHAIRICTGSLGQVVSDPVWKNTVSYEWSDGWQGSPWQVASGTIIGSATVAIATADYGGSENDTYMVELSVSRSLFPELFEGDLLTAHISVWCGNDSMNLTGTIVPAPCAILLGSIGVGLIGWLRKRRTL